MLSVIRTDVFTPLVAAQSSERHDYTADLKFKGQEAKIFCKGGVEGASGPGQPGPPVKLHPSSRGHASEALGRC